MVILPQDVKTQYARRHGVNVMLAERNGVEGFVRVEPDTDVETLLLAAYDALVRAEARAYDDSVRGDG